MALGSSAFLRYNYRLDFCLVDAKSINYYNKSIISNIYQYFFIFENIAKRFNTTKNCSICKKWWPYRPV
ncbi:hypothetical protein B9T24_04880 [Acinetobacter sp. ANC 4654]|nr:hypothetical protein B9T24_04880 [Acinetobacter sp. ANC 4654]